MKRTGYHTFLPLLMILLGLTLTVSASAAETVKHSGLIVSIADDARTFVLAELGPWQVLNGKTVITYRTITLVPETAFAIVGRTDTAPSGYPGRARECLPQRLRHHRLPS
jgi:hypothetical protein